MLTRIGLLCRRNRGLISLHPANLLSRSSERKEASADSPKDSYEWPRTRNLGLETPQVCVALPVVEEAVDVTALRIREREPRHDPPRLRWIAVLDCGLEPLAVRFRLL